MEQPKTEREKMLAGELYVAADAELQALHLEACRLTRLYNNTGEEERDLRSQLLHQLFAKVGKNPQIVPNFYGRYSQHYLPRFARN